MTMDGIKDGATRLHATTVALDGCAVLLQGPSGAGKSDLALRLIDDGAVLVADDQTLLRAVGGELLATAPAELAGRLEVRGLGIVELPTLAEAPVKLVAVLDPAAEIARLPASAAAEVCSIVIPQIALRAFEASAAAKLKLALRNSRRGKGES